jgi:hypothetical protein
MNKKNKTLAMLITLLFSATFISATLIFQEASEPIT